MSDTRWAQAEDIARDPFGRPGDAFGSLNFYTQEMPPSMLISMVTTFLLTLLTLLLGIVGVIGGEKEGVHLAHLGPPIEIVLGEGAAALAAVADGAEAGSTATEASEGVEGETSPDVKVSDIDAELGNIPDPNATIKVDGDKAKRLKKNISALANGIQIDGLPDVKTVGGGVPISGVFRELVKDSPSMVFVIDKSGSMFGVPLQRVTAELAYAINSLTEEQKFFVIFFDHTTWPMHATSGQSALGASRPIALVPGVPQQKQDAINWMNSMQGSGGTDPSGGMLMALAAKPSKIVLLSDGEFSPLYVDEIRRRNNGETIIDCIGLSENILTLQQIAAQNGGRYFQAK